MKKGKRIFTWLLVMCMFFSNLYLVPSAAQESKAEEIVINVLEYGADPTGATDSAEAIWHALQAAKEAEQDGKIL